MSAKLWAPSKGTTKLSAACDNALVLEPKLVGAWISRGILLMHMKRPTEALAAYDERWRSARNSRTHGLGEATPAMN